MHWPVFLDPAAQDLRYAARTLRTSRGFTIAAVCTFALGIGATTAIFSVVNAVLLRPLPYRAPEQLVSVDGMSYKGELLEIERRARSIEVAAFLAQDASLTGGRDPVQLQGAAISPNLFPLLGVSSALGRTFLPEERTPGRDAVVVLSDALWRGRFGGAPDIVGRSIDLDAMRRTVVGVMPPGVRFPDRTTQFWIPLIIDPADRVTLWSTGATIVGRLRPGATLTQARAEVAALAPRMRDLFPWHMPSDYGRGATVTSLLDHVTGAVRPLLLVLLGAVAFVLLIACVNVANLLLVRAQARQRELAVRAALGAGAERLVRQLLTESVLLALAGGVVGLVLAFWGVHALRASLPPDTPRLADIAIDARVLGAACLAVLGTGIAFGLAPAMRAGRADVRAVLQESARGSSGGVERRRLSHVLVASEIALAMVLVTGAGLFIRSFAYLVTRDPGFRAERLVSATIVPPASRYVDDASRRDFYAALLERLATMPGVSAVAVTDRLPFGGNAYGGVFKIDGRPDPAGTGDWPSADIIGAVSDDYLRTMGIRLVRGRGFTPTDRADAPSVVLIDEALARRYWPGEDPIGKRIKGPGGDPWAAIVGVVSDVKHGQLSDEHTSAFFRPIAQSRVSRAMAVVVRTTANPQAFAANLRGAVAALDPDTPVSDIRTMRERIAASLARPRFALALLAGFGALALVLGAVGIYGVIAYAVSQRTREIGVRLALGAREGDVLRMIMRQGAVIALAGIAGGLAAAAGVTRVLASLLVGVSSLDPVTFAVTPLVLVAVALVATWLPARRAARTSPTVALRADSL